MSKIHHNIIVLGLIFISNFIFSQSDTENLKNNIFVKDWLFSKGIHNKAATFNCNESSFKPVTIPHTYSMDAIKDIGYYKGQAWYRTNLKIPSSMNNERIFIRFEGVGQEATLYINEKKVGSHIGGYSAFIFEITNFVDFQKNNLIAVEVTNEPNFKRIPVNDKLFNHYGGIYRPVEVFSTPKSNIDPTFFASSGVFVKQLNLSKNNAEIEIETHISSSNSNEKLWLNYKVWDQHNNIVYTNKRNINTPKTKAIVKEKITIENPILWNGKINPHLYSIKVTLNSNTSSHTVIEKFGLRTFKVDPKKGFFLNKKPYRVYGVAMHQEWQQTGPALLQEHHKKDMALVNEIGATGLRLSHYQHSKLTYEIADELGLLVWTEIPFVHDYSGREGANAKQQLKELIYQNFNSPSIFVWGIWNEVRAWNSSNEPCVLLTKELTEIAHKIDSSRLTASASDRGILSNMGNITDLQAWNKYYGWYYGAYNDMANWLDTSRAEHPNIALGISEYGIGGNIYQQNKSKLDKPSGDYFPEPEQTNYHEITWKIIKDRPFIWSSFIWNMFDFSVAGWNRGGIKNLNHKGLITYDRKTKKDAFYFYKANWRKSPVLYISELRNTQRLNEITDIKVFSNLKKITLNINGEIIKTQLNNSDINTIVFKNIQLSKGENVIEVFAKSNNQTFTHKAIWNLDYENE